MSDATPIPKNSSEVNSGPASSIFDTPLPISNEELEREYRAILKREATAGELEYLNTHPELFTYGFLNFCRGCDWTNGRYVNVIDKVIEKMS